jgi:hypothetical protein
VSSADLDGDGHRDATLRLVTEEGKPSADEFDMPDEVPRRTASERRFRYDVPTDRYVELPAAAD